MSSLTQLEFRIDEWDGLNISPHLLTNLKELSLLNCYAFTAPGIISMATGLTGLLKLTLDQVDDITDEAGILFMPMLKSLTYLNISTASDFTGEGLNGMLSSNLIELHLPSDMAISPKGINDIFFNHLPKLTLFNLQETFHE